MRRISGEDFSRALSLHFLQDNLSTSYRERSNDVSSEVWSRFRSCTPPGGVNYRSAIRGAALG